MIPPKAQQHLPPPGSIILQLHPIYEGISGKWRQLVVIVSNFKRIGQISRAIMRRRRFGVQRHGAAFDRRLDRSGVPKRHASNFLYISVRCWRDSREAVVPMRGSLRSGIRKRRRAGALQSALRAQSRLSHQHGVSSRDQTVPGLGREIT